MSWRWINSHCQWPLPGNTVKNLTDILLTSVAQQVWGVYVGVKWIPSTLLTRLLLHTPQLLLLLLLLLCRSSATPLRHSQYTYHRWLKLPCMHMHACVCVHACACVCVCVCVCVHVCVEISFVPRPKEGPGTYCLCMRAITLEFQGNKIRLKRVHMSHTKGPRQFVSNEAIVCICTWESWMLVFVPYTWTEGLYYSVFLMARMFLCSYFILDFENLSVTKSSRFDKKLNRENNFVFIVSLLVSLMFDHVCSLCISVGPYVLLKDVHRTNALRKTIV